MSWPRCWGCPKPPRAIESYDISNWGDGTSVCGMVTFKDGKPFKAGYRKFKMKTVAGTDDYASLAETVSRRAAEYEKYAAQAENGQPGGNWFGQKPDLLLMDGGRGQVSAAKEALAGTALAEVPLFGMVKDDHHRTRAMVDSEGREIAINMNRGTFTFITAIQDETHRFANAYRKQQMKQKSYSSTLTEVPGVGPKLCQSPAGPVQERGGREGGHPRPAGKHPRCGQAAGPDHLRLFSSGISTKPPLFAGAKPWKRGALLLCGALFLNVQIDQALWQ